MGATGPRRDNTDESGRPHSPAGRWRKSSFSMSNGDCVEVALLGDHVGVRDSHASAGPYLHFPSDVWTAFLQDIRGVRYTK
jgi:Domain of unknown function (DUF397)